MYTVCSSIQGCALAVPGAPSNSPLPLCDNDILLTQKSYMLGTCGVFGLEVLIPYNSSESTVLSFP